MNTWHLHKIGMRWAIRRKSSRTTDFYFYCFLRDRQFRIRKWWRKSKAQAMCDMLNSEDNQCTAI